MSEPLTIVQRKYGEMLSFRFEDEKLVREHSDHTGSNVLTLYYNNINVNNWTITNVDRLKKYRYAIMAVWSACTVLAFLTLPPLAALGVCALIGLGLVIAQQRKWVSSRYTIFRIPNPETSVKGIKVLHDENHDRIVSEIKSRWKARLRRLFLSIDDTNDPVKESKKFDWLRDNDVISAEEYAAALAQIKVGRIPPAHAEPLKVALN
jgi:hypothetical protein